jgi:peptidylprolyl isomerase
VKRNNKKPARLGSAILLAALGWILAACQAATPAVTPVPTTAPTQAGLPTAVPTPISLEGATTTDSGLQYRAIFPGQGDAPEPGDIITMHFIARRADGSELINTYTRQPASGVWGVGRLMPGWEEGIGLMKAGGKAYMLMTAERAFGPQSIAGVPPDAQVLLEVELLSVVDAPAPAAVQEADLTETNTGLQYYDLEVGEGVQAVDKGRVSTLYKMWVKSEDGYEFIDQSTGTGAISFILGRGDTVFPGWEEGVSGMRVGGRRLLVIPAALGMGAQGSGAIPADAVLVMEITLTEAEEPLLPTQVDEQEFTTTASGLKYYDLEVGDGETPTAGQTLVVHYTGWLEDGTVFDSSQFGGQPIIFPLGLGRVIPGWDEGLATMKVGGRRQLVIPPALGYGEEGAGDTIPPGATLIFEVELVSIQP